MSDIVNTTEYAELTNAVQAIKGVILQSQQRTLAAINQEQLALYYGIGRFVSSFVETNKLVDIENNSFVEPFELASQVQAQLLGATFEMLSGGPAQAHVGTGGGGSSSDMPWGEKNNDNNLTTPRRKR